MEHPDARLQPGAYVANASRLCEVVEYQAGAIVLEDCATGDRQMVVAWRVLTDWQLVKCAPCPPDYIPAAA